MRTTPMPTRDTLPLALATLLVLAVAAVAAGVGGMTLHQSADQPVEQPPAASSTARLADMADRLTTAMKNTPGCLGVDSARTNAGKFVIFGWFEDKAAAMNWYNHPMHAAMRRMSGLAGDDREPMADVPDGVPVMALACMQFDGEPAVEGSPIPFSAISIELYTPLEGGLRLNGGFAPEAFVAAEAD